MTRPIMYHHFVAKGIYQAAYRDGPWVDLDPGLYWALWHGKATT